MDGGKVRGEALSRPDESVDAASTLDRTRLELAVEATALGIWEWNVETGETIWSDRQKAIWGLEPDHAVSYELWRDSIHPEDRDAVLQRIEHTLNPGSGGGQVIEHRIVRPSGSVRWIASHGRMIYHEKSLRPLKLIGTVLDITRRKRAEEDLRRAIEVQDILLREVNHRIKNSLQIVSSMLSLQSGRLEDPEMRALIKEAQMRVQAVAAVHERLYRSTDIKSVDLDAFLETLCSDLERTISEEDSIVVEVRAEPVQIGYDHAVPIALILNELLTNAIKYAYPDRRGTIVVTLDRPEPGRARLSVADSGVGLPAGFQTEKQTSLGYRIIQGLARQIGAEIEIFDRRPGTEISVSFAMPTECQAR